MRKFTNHRGYATVFREGYTPLEPFLPIEAYSGAIPDMDIITQIDTASRPSLPVLSHCISGTCLCMCPHLATLAVSTPLGFFMDWVVAMASRT